MQSRKIYLSLIVFLISGMFVGCGKKFRLETQSGRPELNVESIHMARKDVQSLIANKFINNGYFIDNRAQDKLVLKKRPDAGWFSSSQQRLDLNFLDLRNRTRVLTRIYQLEVDGGKVTSKTEITWNPVYAKKVQSIFDSISATLENQRQFKNFESSPDKNKKSAPVVSDKEADPEIQSSKKKVKEAVDTGLIDTSEEATSSSDSSALPTSEGFSGVGEVGADTSIEEDTEVESSLYKQPADTPIKSVPGDTE